MLVYRASGPNDTRRLGEALGKLLGPGDVVCLDGRLGAGKTVFVQGVAAGMGVRGRVTSPTFTIIHEHPGRVPLYHIDAYRLDGAPDAATVGIEDYVYGSGAVAIEWPERIRELLPEERLDVEIMMPADGDGGREDARGHRSGGRRVGGNESESDGESESDSEGEGEGEDVSEGECGDESDSEDEGASDHTREIVFSPRGERFRRMVEELRALAGPGD
ncbi:MAG: tRNA (adenosine(37)-N6)-threonylcarbamoyltransferase complex ATPase subunit type 1 TsaE [Bacillota bacterium]|nr:tRNA (adenosine(37)-N6)-threonylcarbamoyltransferase complex ATPase subunit type 1 TsaE [Bacillota bacterium]